MSTQIADEKYIEYIELQQEMLEITSSVCDMLGLLLAKKADMTPTMIRASLTPEQLALVEQWEQGQEERERKEREMQALLEEHGLLATQE